jgi:type IV pilus assembly protein PilM
MALRNTIGLDIGSSSIKVVQLKPGKRGLQLAAFDLEPVAPQTIVDGSIMNQGAVVDAIRAVMARLKIKEKDVAVAIAGHSVIIKKITVPAMTPDELEEQIPWEAEHHIPFAKDDVEIDHTVINPQTPQGQMELILVAAKKEVVHDYAAVAKEARLNPAVVDVAAFSVQNAWELAADPVAGQTVALINVGASISNINIVTNSMSAFTRDVTIGGNAFTEEIQKQLNVSHEQAEAMKIGQVDQQTMVQGGGVDRVAAQVAEVMAGEFQRSIDFYLATSADAHVDRIVLSGGGSKVPSLQRAIERRSRLPIEMMNPFRRLSVEGLDQQFIMSHAPEAAVGVGLALRAAGDR